MVYVDTTETPTTQPAPSTGTGSTNQESQHLLTDITGTVKSIKDGDWLAAGIGLTNVAMDIIGMTGNPLQGLLSAGIGWLIEHVKFLKEPFDKLLGNPESINSTAQSWGSAASILDQVSTQLRQSSTSETSNWTGGASDAYRTASDTHANAVASLGQASNGMGQAMTGVGQVLAMVRKAVLDLISKAVRQIIQIIIEALSSSWATFGASIAAGIIKAVQTAISAAQKCISKIQKFLQSAQKVIQLIQKVLQAAQAIKQLIKQMSSKTEDTGTTDSQTQAMVSDGLGISSDSLSTMDDQANANYAHGVTTPAYSTMPALIQVSDTPTVNTDTTVTPVDDQVHTSQVSQTPTVNQNTRPLPRGVPSWGPSGPPPDEGRSYSRTQINDWINQARQVMATEGTTISDQDAARIAGLIEHESSNNPHAINLWDSNATAGHPSKGLMQTIDGTFDRFHMPGHDNIYDPVDNIIAGTRYGIHTYGSIGRIPGVRATEHGGSYVGY